MANDRIRQEKAREAPIHFELYRRIKNCLESKRAGELVEFSELVPEKPVVGVGSADLVLEQTGSSAAFLVIEVKKRTPQSMLVFDDDPRRQALGYAKKLNAQFYAISDGEAFRLFKTGADRPLGEYSITLAEDFAGTLLNGLREIHLGNAPTLPFPAMEAPLERIRESTSALGQTLLNVFESLRREGIVEIRQESPVTHVSVGNIRGILRLGLYPPEKTGVDYIDVRLDLLRKALGERFSSVVEDLSAAPAFNWITEGNWETETNKWRKLRSIAVQDPDLDQTAKDLTNWLTQIRSENKLGASAG